MRISLDIFADMLGMKTGDVIHALRTGGVLEGVYLPATLRKKMRQIEPDGTRPSLNFPLNEAMAFIHKWQKRGTSYVKIIFPCWVFHLLVIKNGAGF